jgi:uncharacterized protein YjiS (DUF1127 family)
MTTNSHCLARPPAVPAAPRAGRVTRFLGMLFTRIAEWQERAEQRAHLAAMNDRMLKDVGISHVDALREASKPFWKP